jgi:hypothetical protein
VQTVAGLLADVADLAKSAAVIVKQLVNPSHCEREDSKSAHGASRSKSEQPAQTKIVLIVCHSTKKSTSQRKK